MTVTSKLTAVTLASLGLALVASTAFAEMRGDGMGRHGGGFMDMDFAAMDADKDGKVTPAEIEAFHTARLKAADTDGDGFLSEAEVQAMITARMQERTKAMAAKMIERQDRDGDGKLSLAEMQPRSPQERMFDRIDTDKDGAISEAEMEAAKKMMTERRDGKRGHHRGKDGKRGHGNK